MIIDWSSKSQEVMTDKSVASLEQKELCSRAGAWNGVSYRLLWFFG
jgi:hypothetical protein